MPLKRTRARGPVTQNVPPVLGSSSKEPSTVLGVTLFGLTPSPPHNSRCRVAPRYDWLCCRVAACYLGEINKLNLDVKLYGLNRFGGLKGTIRGLGFISFLFRI